MESLKKFWHWADNEKPSRELFDKKATMAGPLSAQAQAALEHAVCVVNEKAPSVLHPTGEVLRPAIKLLSFAIMEAWALLEQDSMIQDALNVQNTGLLKTDPDYANKLRLYAMPLQTKRDAELVKACKVIATSNPIDSRKARYAAYYTDIREKMVPVIGEMGVTRSTEHDELKQQIECLLEEAHASYLWYLHLRVDSRGIWFESKEFGDICRLVQFQELQSDAGIDRYKLFLIINTMRLDVVTRKSKARGA